MTRGNCVTWISLASAALIVCSAGQSPLCADSGAPSKSGQTLQLHLRTRVETSKGSNRYHTIRRKEDWDPRKTALIVCDVWDLHHCLNAVRRVEEFAPRLEKVLQEARGRGVTIIHAPSDCMAAYKDHPGRLHAQSVPKAKDLPKEIETWCSRIPAEERGRYPIDQSDGGEDDDPAEHRAWAEKLTGMGRNPKAPWKSQTKLLTISDQDYISDKGDEVWNILQQRGIDNVILAGVHTNMCVLGRPFGLRQMARNGKHVVLMRDMTDTMYNPQCWPYVSHFTGTDFIVEHIEKFVCPTITSDQFIGGKAFRFKKDARPHIVMMIGEDEYETHKSLPAFAASRLGKGFRVSTIFASDKDPHDFRGIEALSEADVLLVSVRRRGLKPEQMAALRRFVEAGKPVVGIRTASHAFSPKQEVIQSGYLGWPEFDRDVLGGNYHGHHGNNKPKSSHTFVRVVAGPEPSAILTGIRTDEFAVTGSLYKTSPLAAGSRVLMMGRVTDVQQQEPVAWTFNRADGGRSFYTSLGHLEEFNTPDSQRLLLNGIYWAAGLPIPKEFDFKVGKAAFRDHWTPIRIPSMAVKDTAVIHQGDGPVWFRCLIKVPPGWQGKELTLSLQHGGGEWETYLNGRCLGEPSQSRTGPISEAAGTYEWKISPPKIEAGELNLLAVRAHEAGAAAGSLGSPEIRCGAERIALHGNWQFRLGDDPTWAGYALPAKFAGSTDIVFEWHAADSR